MTGRLECLGCHRTLKRPSPTGYGPVCARKRGLTPKKPRRTAPVSRPRAAIRGSDDPVPVIPGQTEIPLVFHQPTLESL